MVDIVCTMIADTDNNTHAREMKMSTEQHSDAYNTGFEAHEQGDSRSDCPYATGTWDASEWLAGWDAAAE